MKKEIIARVIWAESIIAEPENADLDAAVKDMARWISYFQHERLVHLIVTALFAVLAMMSVIMLMLAPSMTVIALIFLLTVLLLFYIRHYYLLENRTQVLYSLMDKIVNLQR